MVPCSVETSIKPSGPGNVLVETPDRAAGPPASKLAMWPVSCISNSSPELQCTRTAIWFDCVPEQANTADSFPSISATIDSRRLTVGSSPDMSSPTSAVAMASRIPGVGLVTVSLLRS